MKTIILLILLIPTLAIAQGKKISQLPSAGALSGPELFETVQGGINKKVTLTEITAFSTGGSFWPLAGAATFTNSVTIDADGNDLDIINIGIINYESTGVEFEATNNIQFTAPAGTRLLLQDSISLMANDNVHIHPQDSFKVTADFWKLNGTSGTDGQVPTVQSDGTVKFETPSSGGATAAGSTGDMQYKSAGGGLQAEAANHYDSATNTLSVTNFAGAGAALTGIVGTNVTNTPAGNIAATTAQAAINELDTEKQPLDGELTAIAGLTSAANKIPEFTGSGTAQLLTRDTDGTLAGNSDTNISSQKAVKTYVDATLLAARSLMFAASDEVTILITQTGMISFRMPYGMTLTSVRASLVTAQTGNGSGGIFTVDINESGSTILSTKLTIDNNETTSTTAVTPAVISDSTLADDAVITIDIDQVGNGTAAGLKIVLKGS